MLFSADEREDVAAPAKGPAPRDEVNLPKACRLLGAPLTNQGCFVRLLGCLDRSLHDWGSGLNR